MFKILCFILASTLPKRSSLLASSQGHANQAFLTVPCFQASPLAFVLLTHTQSLCFQSAPRESSSAHIALLLMSLAHGRVP